MTPPTFSSCPRSVDDTQRFTTQLLAHLGATFTPADAPSPSLARWDVTFPTAAQRSPLQLAFSPAAIPLDDDTTQLLTPHCPLFSVLTSCLDGGGPALRRALPAAHPAPRALPKGLDPTVRGAPSITPSFSFDLELAARVTFFDEGRDERLLLCWLPDRGPAQLSDTSRLLTDAATLIPIPPDAPHPSPDALNHRLRCATDALTHWATTDAHRRESNLLERLSREVHRLTTYYGELMAQHEDEDALRSQLALDLNLRVGEALRMHHLHVDIQPLQYALILRPQLTYTYWLGRSAQAPSRAWRFDLSSGDWLDPDLIADTAPEG
jgi:hypothetical protein